MERGISTLLNFLTCSRRSRELFSSVEEKKFLPTHGIEKFARVIESFGSATFQTKSTLCTRSCGFSVSPPTCHTPSLSTKISTVLYLSDKFSLICKITSPPSFKEDEY